MQFSPIRTNNLSFILHFLFGNFAIKLEDVLGKAAQIIWTMAIFVRSASGCTDPALNEKLLFCFNSVINSSDIPNNASLIE